MQDSYILKIINSMNKACKLFCNKLFLNGCYVFFLILIILALTLMFVVIGTNGKNTSWAIWTGLGFLLLFLISFYVFEFIRRRCRNEISNKCNLRNLYGEELVNAKMIDDNLNSLNLNQNFIRMHADSLIINYDNSTLSTMNDGYSFFIKNRNYQLSSCFINNYNKSFSKQNDLQIIVSTQISSKNNDLYIVQKNDNKSIIDLKKIKDYLDFSIYGNTNLSNNEIEKLINKLLDLNKDIKVNIRIKEQTIYLIFMIENRLLINSSGMRFHKQLLNEIDDIWSQNLALIKQIIKTTSRF